MPINNDNVPTRKYAIFVGATSLKLSQRLVLINARKQMRSEGKAQLIMLRKTRLDEAVDPDIVVGDRVCICDGALEANEELTSPTNILWSGTITDITSDIFHQVADAIGTVICEEIGLLTHKQPVTYGSYPFLDNGQIFNPFIEDKFFGNKTPDASSFSASDFAECRPEKEFLAADEKKVWTLQSVLEYLCNKVSIAVEMPWEADNVVIAAEAEAQRQLINSQFQRGMISAEQRDQQLAVISSQETNTMSQNKAKYGILLDYAKPRSYENYIGKTIAEMLDALIEKPLDYYFDPTVSFSSVYGKLTIVNTSSVEILNIVPGAKKIKMKSNENTTNINVSVSDNRYDQVIIRGDNILFAGTFGSWSFNNQDTITKDWLQSEEQLYVAGDADAQGVYAKASDEGLAAAFRQQYPDVYTRFKFNPNVTDGANIDAVQVHMDPMDKTSTTRQPFFPFVEFRFPQGQEARTLPKVNYSWGFHQTPDKLNLRWSDELPQPEYSTLTQVISSAKGHKIQPFAIALGMTADGKPFYFNTTLDGGAGVETTKLGFYNGNTAGIKVQQKIPESAAWNNDKLFTVDGVIQSNPASPFWGLDTAGPSPRNPTTSDYKFLTHWGTYLVTVAGYSKQKLELQKQRTDANGVVLSIPNPRIKIIEDPSLQLWFVHPGTVMGLTKHNDYRYEMSNAIDDASNFVVKMKPQVLADASSVLRNQPKIYRNDIPKAKDLLNSACAFYFLEKRSLKYEEMLMNYAGGIKIGQVVGEIVDGPVTHNINTAVYSIEYDASIGQPRVLISTSVPEVPILTRLNTKNELSTSTPLAGSAKSTPRVVSPPAPPTIGAVTGGAGGGAAAQRDEIWLKVLLGEAAGNTLASGQFGIRKVGAWTNLTTWLDAYATSSLAYGLGRATLWINGIQQFTADASLYVAGASYSVNQKVSYNDIGYKCSVAGASTTFNTGTAVFVVDSTIAKKAKHVFLLLDDRAQFGYAVQNGEWIRVFSEVAFGTAINPATGVEQEQTAYTGAFF